MRSKILTRTFGMSEFVLKETEKKPRKSPERPLLVSQWEKRSTPVIVLRAGSRRRFELFLETLEGLQTASSP